MAHCNRTGLTIPGCAGKTKTGKREVFDSYQDNGNEEWHIRSGNVLSDVPLQEGWFPVAWTYMERPPDPPRESLQSLALRALLIGAAVGMMAGFLIGVAVTF
jgi:hypothetical protein